MNSESSSRGTTNGILKCNVQKTDTCTCNNSVDQDDGNIQGYINECKLNHAEVKYEHSQETTKPEIRTMKMPFTGISDLKKKTTLKLYRIPSSKKFVGFFYLKVEKFPK